MDEEYELALMYAMNLADKRDRYISKEIGRSTLYALRSGQIP